MMAFMATILAQGVAAASRSDYSARPGSLDHEAYGNEHMLYNNRWTPPAIARKRTRGRRSVILST